MAPITTADLRASSAAAERRWLATDAPMAPLTTLRVGGPADRLVEVQSRDELLAALALARDAEIPGSSSATAATWWSPTRGSVDSSSATGPGVEIDGSGCTPTRARRWRCSSGAAPRGLGGLEFGTSIPGTLGGAVWANAGAHGREMRDVVATVEAWEPSDGSAG